MNIRAIDGDAISEINARIDRLPKWGLPYTTLLIVGFLYVFVFYDITVIAVAIPGLNKSFHIGHNISLPITFNLVGYIVGAVFLSSVADRLGRRRALMFCVVSLFLGAMLGSLSWNVTSLAVFRFILGVGMGAQISLATTLVSELSPAAFRGRYVGYCVIGAAVGNAIPPFLGIPLLSMPATGWRILFALPAIVILFLIFFRDRWLPESPRWLVLHGKMAEAERIVSAMENRVLASTGSELPPIPTAPTEGRPASAIPLLELFKGAYLGRLCYISIFWFFYYVFIYAYLSFEPTLLSGLGLALPSALLLTGIGYLGFIVGATVQTFVVDRIERKMVILAGLVAQFIGIALLATSSSSGEIILGGLLIALGNFAILGPGYAYTAELFPTRARGSAMAIADGGGHLGGAVQPFIVIATLDTFGARTTFWVIAVFLIICASLISVGLRTSRKELTEIAK